MARVLIVDDDRTSAIISPRTFSIGHVLETAAIAETALDLLKGEPFDIVLSDIRLERMNGRVTPRDSPRATRGRRRAHDGG
jgi:CheY-like chemotaxis protein